MAHNPIEQFVPGGNTSTATVFDVTQVDSSALFPIGQTVKCLDSTLGTISEFMYARGVASVTAGDACILSIGDEAAILVDDAVSGAEFGAVIGWAMAAVVADSYGWFQIRGRVAANVAANFADDGQIFATTTAGTVDDAAGGKEIIGARAAGAIGTPATGQAYIDVFYAKFAGTETT